MSTGSSDRRRGGKEAGSAGRRSYASRTDEEKVAYPTRLLKSNYDALMAASSGTGVSGNSLVNEAIEHYLVSPEFRARLERARAAQEEAIKKLSGG